VEMKHQKINTPILTPMPSRIKLEIFFPHSKKSFRRPCHSLPTKKKNNNRKN